MFRKIERFRSTLNEFKGHVLISCFVLCIVSDVNAKKQTWSVTVECNEVCPPKETDTIFVDEHIKDFSVDNTATLAKLLDNAAKTNRTLKFGPNTYYITDDLVISGGVTVFGIKGKTVIKPLKNHSVTSIILAKAPLSISDIIIDGGNTVTYGINSYDNLSVTNCTFRNIMGNKERSGIGLRHLQPKKKVDVTDCVFDNIGGFEDGKEGNAIGANRAIYLKGLKSFRITNTTFNNIQGAEDGDCIQIETSVQSGIGWASVEEGVIENCMFSDFGKRAIKLMASGIHIRNCTIKDPRNSARKASSAISLYGSNNRVSNNKISINNAIYAILLAGGNDNVINNNTIELTGRNRAIRGIYNTKSRKFIVEDNEFILPNGVSEDRVFQFSEQNKDNLENNNQHKDKIRTKNSVRQQN